MYSNRRRRFVTTVLKWYVRNGRRLPWRNISNPYQILVSEIMLQQTQVSRVLAKYPEFLHRFPTIRRLAAARQRDVVVAWQGMGYNNRAVRLHVLAQTVVKTNGGRIPNEYHALRSLPGIGRYTANAILSSAFGKRVPVVDVNVRRVLSRVFRPMRSLSDMRTEAQIWDLAAAVLPRRRAYIWNQGLMDLGATICTSRSPSCPVCPAAGLCLSRRSLRKTNVQRVKNEPSHSGLPNRVYRGRIIEELRKGNGKTRMRLDSLGRRVLKEFSRRDANWLRNLVLGLERDGLVKLSGNGSPKTQHVSLA